MSGCNVRMKTLLIFGVSPKQGTAYQVLQVARKCHPQWRCIVLVRHAELAQQLTKQGVECVIGDATDPVKVNQLCQLAGPDAIIVSTLSGVTGNYTAQRIIIDCAEQMGLKQMLLVTSLGCGDTWSTLSTRAKQAFGLAVREKSLAEIWLQTSTLNHLILRPGGLIDGPSTGHGQCYYQQEVHGFIHRNELAELIITMLTKQQWDNRAYSVIDPSLKVAN